MKLLIILSLFLAPSLLFAQYAESIRTARPGQGIGAYTLGKNVLQVQSGLNLEKYENDVSDVSTNTWNTVIRLGVFEGKGYTSEATITLIKYGFTKLNLNRIEAIIAPENTASLKIIEKLGMQKEGHLKQHYMSSGAAEDSIIFGILKPS